MSTSNFQLRHDGLPYMCSWNEGENRQYNKAADSKICSLFDTLLICAGKLSVARTSADLDGEEKIRQKDIEKVLTCRELDKSNSKMVGK